MSRGIRYAFPQQNDEEFVKLLKAQRYYYKVAKRWQMGRLIVSITIPLIIAIAKLKSLNEFEEYKKFFSWLDLSWIILLSLTWIAISFILKLYEKKYISLAASIQEKFDSKLFKIEKNQFLFPSTPPPEKINNGADKFRGNIEKLYNWYPLEDSGNNFLNILLAQRTNIVWDKNLKVKYRNLLLSFLILILFVEILVAWSIDLKFRDALTVLFLSTIPLFVLLGEYAWELSKQINSNEIVGKKILDLCEKIQAYSHDELKCKCRQVQDYIYERNRLRSILIPEWLYWLRRDKDNQDILETNRTLIRKYNLKKEKSHAT